MTKKTADEKITVSKLLAAIKDTSEFKQYSHDSRADVVNALKAHSFKTVLDLDCGTGLLLKQMFEAFPDMTACGFDYSLDRIAEAKKRLADCDAEFKFGNALQLPYEDNQFDLVVSTSTFNHYTQPLDILTEVARVLKPNGLLMICDTYLNATLRYLHKISKPINQVAGMRIYTEKEVWQMMNAAGFTGIKWEKINRFTYLAQGVVAKLPELN